MTNRRFRGHACLVSVLLTLSTLIIGCSRWSERGAKGLGTLPPASPNETKFSSYQPAHPYQQLAKGLLGRKLYAAPPEVGITVEVDDFLVGPNQRSETYALQAAGIFEVKTGRGLLKLGDNPQQIETGTVVSVHAAQLFTIENQSEIPIAIRVELLGSK